MLDAIFKFKLFLLRRLTISNGTFANKIFHVVLLITISSCHNLHFHVSQLRPRQGLKYLPYIQCFYSLLLFGQRATKCHEEDVGIFIDFPILTST